jgi:hypothetical protein
MPSARKGKEKDESDWRENGLARGEVGRERDTVNDAENPSSLGEKEATTRRTP